MKSKKLRRGRNKSIRRTRNTRRMRSRTSARTRKTKRMHRHRRKIMLGGDLPATTLSSTPIESSSDTPAQMAGKNADMNKTINALKGGRGRRRGQSGGAVPCCTENNPYSYPCPPGMCGPVPNAIGQNIINTALTVRANAEFDARPPPT